jgi:hypothetical protein
MITEQNILDDTSVKLKKFLNERWKKDFKTKFKEFLNLKTEEDFEINIDHIKGLNSPLSIGIFVDSKNYNQAKTLAREFTLNNTPGCKIYTVETWTQGYYLLSPRKKSDFGGMVYTFVNQPASEKPNVSLRRVGSKMIATVEGPDLLKESFICTEKSSLRSFSRVNAGKQRHVRPRNCRGSRHA